MSNPIEITSSGQIVTGAGVIEILSLSAYDQSSSVDIYEGLYENGVAAATHIWKIKATAHDYRDSNILNIPYKKGVFAIINGTGAGLFCTIR